MPVVEFALDTNAQQRIQVHIPVEPTAITVLFNRSVLGFLATPDELRTGKYFTLPDRSNVYVRMEGRRPQVFRNNYPLTPLEAADAAFDGSSNKKSGVGLLTRLVKGSGRE